MGKTCEIALADSFLDAYSRLPRSTARKFSDFMVKFRQNPASAAINLEKVTETKGENIFSARIDDAYRAILARVPGSGTYVVLWADHHDEAYAWARDKRCEVNSVTGTLQLYTVPEAEKAKVPGAGEPEPAVAGLFDGIREEDLLRIGVPGEQMALVRSFREEEDLAGAAGALPAEVSEYLQLLAAGCSLQEVMADIGLARKAEEGAGAEDRAAALCTPEAQKSFYVVEGEEELGRILSEPMEKWRIFLHPTQRRIVKKSYGGPARVLGGAGTGKTVVAMHRAKFLASKLTGGGRILFTTFTANLASDIRENLKKICTPAELEKIEVIHLDAWTARCLKEMGCGARIVYDSGREGSQNDVARLWEQAVRESGTALKYGWRFFQEEWERVMLAQDTLTKEAYLQARRPGRGVRLNRKGRLQVWEVLERYCEILREQGVRDSSTATYECRRLLLAGEGAVGYSHVIVDEGQDFSDNAYRLLRAVAGEEHPDDIFIVGDAHQRIYRNRPALSRCGINVRGRSARLRINYRTTEETRRHAYAVLQGLSFDDLDGGEDGGADRSLMHGERPKTEIFPGFEQECGYILGEIGKLRESGAKLRDICVVARTKGILDGYKAALSGAGIKVYEIKRSNTDNSRFEGIRAATMHRVKGLEFEYVFIAGANSGVIPLAAAVNRADAASEQEGLTSERCLFYVALTRARRGAYVTGFGKPSEFLL